MNVFYISYIYKSAISSHTKPGLFGTTTLTLLLTGSWISPFVTSEPDFQHILEFPVSWISWLRPSEIPDFRMFGTPRLHRSKIPESRLFVTSRFHKFKIPENRMFAILRPRGLKISENRDFFAPEKHILRISLSSTFRGWRVFLNSPTVKTTRKHPARLQSTQVLVAWTFLGPLPRRVPRPTTAWAPGTTRLRLHGTRRREAQGNQRASTRLGN
jgi:hypothetical protein